MKGIERQLCPHCGKPATPGEWARGICTKCKSIIESPADTTFANSVNMRREPQGAFRPARPKTHTWHYIKCALVLGIPAIVFFIYCLLAIIDFSSPQDTTTLKLLLRGIIVSVVLYKSSKYASHLDLGDYTKIMLACIGIVILLMLALFVKLFIGLSAT